MSKKIYNSTDLPLQMAIIQLELKRFSTKQGLVYSEMILLASCYYFHLKRGFFTVNQVKAVSKLKNDPTMYRLFSVLVDKGLLVYTIRQRTKIFSCTVLGAKIGARFGGRTRELLDAF